MSDADKVMNDMLEENIEYLLIPFYLDPTQALS
jgi:hypothetical protein